MKALSQRLRSMMRNNRPMATHYPGCWEHHDDCALSLAAAILDLEEETSNGQ